MIIVNNKSNGILPDVHFLFTHLIYEFFEPFEECSYYKSHEDNYRFSTDVISKITCQHCIKCLLKFVNKMRCSTSYKNKYHEHVGIYQLFEAGKNIKQPENIPDFLAKLPNGLYVNKNVSVPEIKFHSHNYIEIRGVLKTEHLHEIAEFINESL